MTGGNGFLGSHLVERLRAVAGNVVFAPPLAETVRTLDWYLASR